MKHIFLIVFLLTTFQSFAQRDKSYKSIEEALANKDSVYELDLSGKELMAVPKGLEQFKNLHLLDLSNNKLTAIDASRFPEEIEVLNLSGNKLTKIGANVRFPAKLRNLYLTGNELTLFDPSGLDSIFFLEINDNKLGRLPSRLGNWKILFELKIENNRITEIPATISQCRNLVNLYADNNKLTSLPTSIVELQELSHLYVGKNQIRKLPARLEKLSDLNILNLEDNQLTEIAIDFSKFSKLSIVDLGKNKLTKIPASIFHVSSEVNLSGNKILSVKNISSYPEFKGNVMLVDVPLSEVEKNHLRKILPQGMLFFSWDDYENTVGHPVAPVE